MVLNCTILFCTVQERILFFRKTTITVLRPYVAFDIAFFRALLTFFRMVLTSMGILGIMCGI